VDVAYASPEDKRACVAASTKGQTDRDEGRLIEARQEFLTCARDECPGIVRKSCGDWLADIDERMPSVVVRVQDASGTDMTDVRLTIDGGSVELDGRPVTLNPGQHTLVITQPSGAFMERKVLLAERDKSRLVNIQLRAAGDEPTDDEARTDPPPEGGFGGEEPRRDSGKGKVPMGAWVLGGVGVAGLASFAAFAVIAKNDLDDLKDKCSPNCSDDQTSDGRRNALIADISLGVGAAALVGGVVWAVVGLKRSKESRTSMAIVPTRAGANLSIAGHF
jgi:hypothetical protein